jgi:FkbM family methyltransferase
MFIKDLLSKFFLFNLFSLARFSHARKYLFKNLFRKRDSYGFYVLSKDRKKSLNIWAIKQIKHRKHHFSEDLYFWDIEGERWLANLDHIHGLYEYKRGSFREMYPCDYRNKTVLDVGGYIGDSARFFLKEGARKIVIYEPVEKNVICMKHNLAEYQKHVEIYQKAIAAEDGEMVISSNYPGGHIGFGNRAGRYTIKVLGESFHSILSRIEADIAKIDCEGGEKHLLDVADSDLIKIPYWIIEFHDAQIGEKVAQKFQRSGFDIMPLTVPPGHQQLVHFRRLPEKRGLGQQFYQPK